MELSEQRGGWRRLVAFVVCALLVLAALVALRGPDAVAPTTAELAGSWLLSGPALWHPLALAGAPTQSLFALAGPRAWQNAHVVAAWISLLCWFWTLPNRSWQGLAPLVPGILAVILSGPESGWTGFGLAVLVISAWRALSFAQPPRMVATTLPLAAWLAAWLSPGALVVVAAAIFETSSRLPRRLAVLTALVCLAATQLTPRGLTIWNEANLFVFWSPQATLSLSAIAALVAALAILALAAGSAWRNGSRGNVLAPALLLLAAAWGQTAFLWPAALWLVPAWPTAIDRWRHIGFNFRWWMQTAAIVFAAGLVVQPAAEAGPRWYALAMTKGAVRPSLTHAALPASGPVYINPRGLPLARLAGALPAGTELADASKLGREPSLWRAQDRLNRFQAVWLLGEKSDYAPLARHLGESPDWRLAAVDATGCLFVRATRAAEFATEPAQQAAREMWGGANRSSFLSGAALACLAANALPEAGELSASAVRNSDLSAPAGAARARVLVSLADVQGALEESGRAVALDPTSALAWEVRAEALLHAALNDDAYAAAQRALALAPSDVGTVWLAARTANAARAFQTEAELLERLVALTEARGGDAAFYRLYLGQSYAKQGLARPALRELEAAAAAPGLTGEQRAGLQEEIDRVRESAARN